MRSRLRILLLPILLLSLFPLYLLGCGSGEPVQKLEFNPAQCQDKQDNDEDGKIDCEDEDCAGYTFCQKVAENTPDLCQDGKDNDGDKKTDCDDSDCKGYTFCQKSSENTAALCKDGKDNDGDGKKDCDDTDCQGFVFCQVAENTATACQDGKDNDGDKKTDCDDPDCQGFVFCSKQENTGIACQDKKDNDNNGKIDCDDDGCKGFTFCQKGSENTPALCKDGKDNDGDGKDDCDDLDCLGFTFCQKTENTAAQCKDGKDNDSDGKADCDDSDCSGFTFCQKVENTAALCQDGKDNDGDKLVDCADSDCQGFVFCAKTENNPTLCQDKKDNDGDGKIDCDDPDCQGFTFCQKIETSVAQCKDGKDNDGDGKIDCDDDDCKGFVFCQKTENTAGSCQDGKDNDGDGKTDCNDTDCQSFTFCQKTENTAAACQDKKDNDGDGKIDCDDTDCKGFTFCSKTERSATECQDGKDNDGDGKTDCGDTDCKGFVFCQKTENTYGQCQDGKDNDGDGKVDCADTDCQGFTFCQKTENTATQCQDKKDNDGDGKTDCDDTDCKGFFFCAKTENTATQCQDGKDNDGDGKTDCADTDCKGFFFCLKTENTSAQCQDGKDNDGDGKTDCDDTDCQGFFFCQKVENTSALCQDGKDNDGDGKKDCDDSDCQGFFFCIKSENTPANCQDKKDNDGDGKVDCDDTDCQGYYFCARTEDTVLTCQDKKDNDGDGKIDCDDTNCKIFTFCQKGSVENTAAQCRDGVDNDGDGKTDCKDPDCYNWHFCGHYSGYPVTDGWGATWDGLPRAATTWAQADAKCKSLGGRLPTATELYRNNVKTGGSVIGNPQSSEWLWTLISPHQSGQKVLLRLSDGSTSNDKMTNSQQYRCIWPPANPKAGFNSMRCHGDPRGACFKLNDTLNVDTRDRPVLDYAAAANECAFYGGSILNIDDWTKAIHKGLPNGSNNWQWAAKATYWYRNGIGSSIVRWSGLGNSRWYYLRSTWGSLAYTTSKYPFRCVGVGDPSMYTAPKATCNGGCTTVKARRSTLLIDTIDRSATDFKTALTTCRSLGGDLPNMGELTEAIHAGLRNGSYNWLWIGDVMYWFNGGYGHGIARWRGTGNDHWHFNSYGTYAAVSGPTSRQAYRCIWRSTKPALPNCSNTQVLQKVSGKWTCVTKTNGNSNGRAIVQTIDNWGNAWDGQFRTARVHADAVKLCASLGGRLPTASELYRVRSRGNPHKAIGTTANTNYLWTQTPDYRSNYFVAVRVSDGASTYYTNTTSRPYRCIWPAKRSQLLVKGNCYGPPGRECFTSKVGYKVDSYDRLPMSVVSAAYDCKFEGGKLPDGRELTRLIHQGLPNGTNNWLWLNESMYWYNNAYGYALARWSGVGLSTWNYASGLGTVTYGYNRYSFRCIYSPKLR